MRESGAECGQGLLWSPGSLSMDHPCHLEVCLCLEFSTMNPDASMTKVPSLSDCSDSNFNIAFPGSYA